MVESLLSFTFFSFLLALSPGPDNLFVLTQSLSNGFKSGFAVTLGLVSGCIVHTSLLAFGVSAVIAASNVAIVVIKILGALYLFYLAWKVFRTDGSLSFESEDAKGSFLELYKTGVFMNLVNPKVLIFFLAFFPSFLWDKDHGTIGQFYILGLTFMVVALFVFGAIAFLAGRISRFIKSHKNTGLVLKWLQVLVFVGIAVYILLD